MANFAMLRGGKIETIIIADEAIAAMFVDVFGMWEGYALADGKENAAIGATYDPETGEFSA